MNIKVSLTDKFLGLFGLVTKERCIEMAKIYAGNYATKIADYAEEDFGVLRRDGFIDDAKLNCEATMKTLLTDYSKNIEFK